MYNSNPKLCSRWKNTYAMYRSTIPVVFSHHSQLDLWLQGVGNHHRSQKWSALLSLSGVLRSARKSKKDMRHTYPQIDSGTASTPAHKSCAQNQQGLGLPCKKFCMGSLTGQHSWNINGKYALSIAERDGHASTVLGKIGTCNRNAGRSETKRRQAQLFGPFQYW